ncbi:MULTISPECIES: cold-shock protein [Bizionia]|uniref:Cold shock domain-containing protein n=1 Tax=Bizionia algoritergicola TaxID=291187 RepID=A0A5D0QZD2_9FLAO|nr:MULTISPECIES: cold shock domain-containing protein [Bizionia]OBX24106.1 cold-shock protein [Bizionia sp. APA-3]TYB73614.1 cold shock domain-containing protein [Bizionia algoritergicola]
MFKKWINKLFNTSSAGTTKAGSTKSGSTKEGTVKFFNRTKGFGFINVNETDEEIFVHKSNLIDKIKKSDKVTFKIEKGDRGLTATNVKRVKK